MRKLVAVLALATVALAGCGSISERREASRVTQELGRPPVAAAQSVRLSPAPSQTTLPSTSVVASVTVPFTTHPWKWEHPGAAPFAATRAEAMQKREGAIRKLGFPEQCVAQLVAAMGKPGEEVVMKMGDRFSAQVSKGGVVHGLREGGGVVDFKTPMLPGMQLVARAEKWSVTCEGNVQTVYLPAVCFNITAGVPVPVSPVTVPPLLSAPEPVVGVCPDVYHFKLYVYTKKAMSVPGVALTAAKEELEKKFVIGWRDAHHVSRSHYTQLQKALESGYLQYSAIPHVFQVSLIMSPEADGGSPTITKEQVLGDVTVKDFYREISFTKQQLDDWDEISFVPVKDENYESPPRYNLTGLHELRVFNHLPGVKGGEWAGSDEGPTRDCTVGGLFIE